MSAPLHDVRIVELASYVAVPAAGALLADLGAEVIKVEVPSGEVMRHATPRRTGYKHGCPEAPHFHMENRGKRSLGLDLTREEARSALLRVIDRADVVLTNLLPQRLERFGLDAATLRAERPALIFASLNGYGTSGPDANTPAYDYTAYWARTGFMDALHERDAPPTYLRPGVGDHAAALALSSGILAALRVRDRSGEGQEVDVNLMHIGFYVQGNDASMALTTGLQPARHDRGGPRNPLWNQYATADDRWLFLVMINSDLYWPKLCAALERPDLASDERFEGAVARYRNSPELTAILAETFRTRSLAEWEEELAAHSLIWAPVRTLSEALGDPQAAEMRMFSDVSHPEAGPMRTVAPPLHLSAHEMPGDRPAPALGAHSREVLAEAGMSAEEIEKALG